MSLLWQGGDMCSLVTGGYGVGPADIGDVGDIFLAAQCLDSPARETAVQDYDLDPGRAVQQRRTDVPVLDASDVGMIELGIGQGEAGLIGLGWQTVAWSGGQRYPRAAMLQNGFFGSYDVNEADIADFGQWRIGWRPGDPGAGGTPWLPETGVWHKVKPGDTLAALAAAYGTTVQAIAALNPTLITNVNVIDVGWNIRIK
jgi:hypothetical protein